MRDGFVLRLKGDGKRYSLALREGGTDTRTFVASFMTTGRSLTKNNSSSSSSFRHAIGCHLTPKK